MRQSALQRRIVGRAGLVLAAVLALPLIVLIFLVQSNARQELRQSTEQALSSLTMNLDRVLDVPVSEIEALANRSTMRNYASQLVTVPINEFSREDRGSLSADVLSDFDDILSRHRGMYLSVRYITREGRAFGEAFSIGSETQFITQPRQFDMADDATYIAALAPQRETQAFVSPVTFDADSRPDMVTLYAPVMPALGSIEPLGVIQLVVYMQALQDFADTALDDPLVASPGRRVLLIDAAGNVLADTARATASEGESMALALLRTNIGSFTLSGTADGGIASARVLEGYNGIDMPWRIAIVDSSNRLLQRANQMTLLLLMGYAVVVAAGVVVLQFSLGTVTRPLVDVAQRVQGLATGSTPELPPQPAAVVPGDEIDDMMTSISGISQRLSQMNETLESQTQRRRRDLELTSRIGREVAALHEIDALIKRAINLICDEFGYYHAQVFLVDDARVNAVLVHSRGRAGEKLLAQNFKIPVGSETVIGTVTAQGTPVIVNDTARRGRAPHAINPVLAETRAEMGLPLLVGEQVIGVLDVQSKEPDAFHEDDLPVFTLLADQLAVAIHNTRLVAQAERRVQQIDTLNRQLTRSAWEKASERIQLSGGYRYNLLEVERDPEPSGEQPGALQAPISIRNETVGTLSVLPADDQDFTDGDRTVLQAVASRVALAIENARLFQETQASLDETRSLYSATTAISRARDIDQISHVLESALAGMQSDYYTAYLDVSAGLQAGALELFNITRGDLEPLDLSRLLCDYAIPRSGGAFIDDLQELGDPSPVEQQLLQAGVRSLAAINIQPRDDQPGGFLAVAYRSPHHFSEGEERYLNTLADGASVVFNNIILFEQIQSSLEETSILYQASRALSDATTPADVLDVVVSYLIQPHVDQAFIGLLEGVSWDDPASTARIATSWSADGDNSLRGMLLNREVFPAWDRLATPRPLLLDDIQEAPQLDKAEISAFSEMDVRSLVIIPLRVPARSIGFICISSREPFAHHHERDLRTYQAFAEQASLTLEASYLLLQTERRARQLQTSAEVSRRAGTLLELEALMTQVVDLIKESFGYDHAQIFLMDERDQYAVLRASTGEPGRLLLATNHRLAKGSDSVIGLVTSRAEVQVALDTESADVVHKPNPFLPQTRSELALPLIIKGRVIGALDVQSNQPNAFSEQDIAALSTLAAQIAVAIDNARLYQASQEQAANMGFLFDVTTAAAAAETLDETLHNVAANLYDALDALSVAIYLPQMYIDDFGNTRVTMKPMALAGVDQPLSELEEVLLGAEDRLVGQVAAHRQALLISNVEAETRYLPVASQAKSVALLPLISGGEAIGLIVIENERAHAYDSDDLQLFKTMASSLSAIVQSALLLDQLTRTNEQLRELDRLKSDFLANMSHELRTPLNSIIGFSRVMLKGIDGPLTEMQEQDLTTIYNSGQHLLMLINDVLDQAKIAAGKMDLKFDYFDVKPLIEGVKSIGVGLVKDKPINLVVELAPSLPQAYGDEFRTRQVLLNLVSNAAKFTDEGSITMRVYPVDDEKTGARMIRMDVIDTGVGIAEEEMPLLFEAFRQIDSSLTRTHGGTGLGLPIARSLVEMQGGEMSVSSQVNVGSMFSITVPTDETARPPAAEDHGTAPAVNGNGSSNGLDSDTNPVLRRSRPAEPQRALPSMPAMPEKREVLLIEDNKDMVDQFRRALQREGFEVQTADHPAYTEAMASNLRPSVIVMDVNFAEGEGWSILERLKLRDDTFDIPVVVVSLSDEVDRALKLGAHAFVQRPFMPEDLLKAVLDAEQEGRTDRILIIDDQDESVRLLTELLAENGKYRVFSACNGREGVSLVARRRPDLIILDLRMPDMDGFAVLNELRAQPETAAIPVMVVTGEIDLSQDELAQLDNVRILPKTDISSSEFDTFVREVRDHLDGG